MRLSNYSSRSCRSYNDAKQRLVEKDKQCLRAYDKLNICAIKIINNLLNRYDNYYGKYRILLNFFNKVTSQEKD
jgi:hypothetical protein